MNIRIKRTEDFIPKWNKNDKSDLPVKFRLKYLTTIEKDDCLIFSPVKKDVKGKLAGGEVTIDRTNMFKYSVMEIENLTISDENNKVSDIKTPEDLLNNPGMTELFYEVSTYIIKMDARGLSKN